MLIPGFTVRAATLDDAAAIAGVQVRTWHAAYAGMLPQEHLDGRTVELRTAQWNQRLRAGEEDVFVACDPRGSVVGFATGLASSEPKAFNLRGCEFCRIIFRRGVFTKR